MSLTSQLNNGQLARWCADRFAAGTADTAKLVDDAAQAAKRDRRTVRPTAERVDDRHWATIGGAFGLRLGALIEPAPPYYALYGLVGAQLATLAWANAEASRWPSHARLTPAQQRLALELRPSPGRAGWLQLVEDGTEPPPIEPATRAEPVLTEFFHRTRQFLGTHAPLGQVGTRGAETALARVYWLVTHFEDVYRNGKSDALLYDLFGLRTPTVEQLREAAPGPVITELARLSQQLQESGSLAAMRQLAGDPPQDFPLGHAAPVFIPHWADGDLLLTDGTSSTLLDVKTVMRTDHVGRTGRWLWQLLAYAWLDVDDDWCIRNAGLYLARHGALITWPVDELARRLLAAPYADDDDLARLRAEFVDLAHRQAIAEAQSS